MKKYCVMLLLWVGVLGIGYGQSDTIYLDGNRNRVNNKEEASFFRVKHFEAASAGKGFTATYFITGEKESVLPYAIMDSVREGKFQQWFKNGQLRERCDFVDDRCQGLLEKWFEDGQPKAIINYKADTLHGSLRSYYPTGQLKRNDVYNNGKLQEGHCYSVTGEEIPHFLYRVSASFSKGGTPGLYKYLTSKIKYKVPKELRGDKSTRGEVKGKAVISFIINSQGDVVDAYIVDSTHPEFAKKALEVVQQMPKWTPPLDDGELTAQKFLIPVSFRW